LKPDNMGSPPFSEWPKLYMQGGAWVKVELLKRGPCAVTPKFARGPPNFIRFFSHEVVVDISGHSSS